MNIARTTDIFKSIHALSMIVYASVLLFPSVLFIYFLTIL
jgi:hypothetical protein